MQDNFSKEYIADLEDSIGYQFTNLNLAHEALSHPSLGQTSNFSRNYERLEFLGDSILGFLVTELIFHRYKDSDEGMLAKVKAHSVSREIIVKVAKQIELARYIIMTDGEERSGGRTNDNNIENTMEALVAAIYLDSDIDKVKLVVDNLWSEHINNIDFSVADPKTYLQEWLQNEDGNMPTYKVIERTGLVHSPIFTVQVTASEYIKIGTGKSIKEAEKNAARHLITEIVNKK